VDPSSWRIQSPAGRSRPPQCRGRRLVLVRGLRLACAGAAIGLAVAAAFGRLLGGLLYGVHPLDPGTLLLSTLLLLGLAALAAYVPPAAPPVSILSICSGRNKEGPRAQG
jgi:hypothetical protein